MEQQDLQVQLTAQAEKLEAIYRSVEKTRKYFLWTLIATLTFFFLPLIGLALVLPTVIETLTNGYGL